MNTLDLASWFAAIGAVLGLVAALTSLLYARRARKRLPDSKVETKTHVVIVAPNEDRRYFLSVPDGVDIHTLLDRIAHTIQESQVAGNPSADTSKAQD
jgi:hypothetical protein